jgi:ABC-type transporter MlaC component
MFRFAVALSLCALVAWAQPNPAAAQGGAKQTTPPVGDPTGLRPHVETNVRAALASLSAGAPGSAGRAERFRSLMGQFADINAIATGVLGRYAGALRGDPALRQAWEAAFTDFAFANYEDQLDRFRGFSVRATDVTMNQPGRDAMVRTELTPPNGGRVIIVQWRMLNRGAGWRVYDVLVNLRGNELWLGQRQKRQFEAELDKTRGDVRALITLVQRETSVIRARLGQAKR